MADPQPARGLREEALEVMANAIFDVLDELIAIGDENSPASCVAASAALTSLPSLLDARGFAVVPKVATEEMLQAGFARFLPYGTALELWRDQLAASPNPFEEPADGP